MDDLISRQAAIDAFDCTNELIVGGEANAQNVVSYINKVIGKIKALPSVQPEIIRCKDCKFASLTYDGDCKYCQYLAGEFDLIDAVYFDGNDYCSHAERRTDEKKNI